MLRFKGKNEVNQSTIMWPSFRKKNTKMGTKTKNTNQVSDWPIEANEKDTNNWPELPTSAIAASASCLIWLALTSSGYCSGNSMNKSINFSSMSGKLLSKSVACCHNKGNTINTKVKSKAINKL